MTGVKRASPGADDEKDPGLEALSNVELSDSDLAKLRELQDKAARVDILLQREDVKRFVPVWESRREVLKTIAKFWPVALAHNVSIAMHAQHNGDLLALTYLEDIWVTHDEKEPRAYTIEFYFKENPFFSDTVLKKEYTWVPNPESDNTPDENGISKANVDFNAERDLKPSSIKINWKDPEQALTKKYPRVVDEEDDDDLADSGSFFNFFEHASDPFDIGATIAQDVFPEALEYFLSSGDDELDSEDEEDDEDDDDAEIDLEKPRAKKQKV